MKMYLKSPIEDGDFPWPCSCFSPFFFWGGGGEKIYDPILMRMFGSSKRCILKCEDDNLDGNV